MQRVGGIIHVQFNGEVQQARGNWTYNLGRPVRAAVIGADGVHGFTETPQVPFIEGEITDRQDLDLAALVILRDATVTLELANGKMIVLGGAYFASEGTGNSQEGNIACRFEGDEAEEA